MPPPSLIENTVTSSPPADRPSDATVRRDPPPAEIAGYRIERVLGEGGMGIVYLARQPRLDRMVALKAIKDLDDSARGRFQREAKLAAALSHPNLVQVFDILEDGRSLYLVMEYVEGTSLHERIRKSGPLSETQALSVVAAVARALGALHEKGIIHRDIKPGNILLTKQGAPKLMDLGLARKLDSEAGFMTQSGMILGSVHYMSPEQAEDPRTTDARSDVYSLGVTLYHALTGKVPFEASTFYSVMRRHATDPRPDPRTLVPGLSERTVALCQKMMAIRPEDRFPSMSALGAALREGGQKPPDAGVSRAARAPGPKAATSTNAPPVAAPLPRRGGIGLVIAGVLLLGLVLAGAAAVTGWRTWQKKRMESRIEEEAIRMAEGRRPRPTPRTGAAPPPVQPAAPDGPSPAPALNPPAGMAVAPEPLADGRWRWRYDFSDPKQLADWEPMAEEDETPPRIEIRNGRLEVTGGTPAVARLRADLRVDRVKAVASCDPGEATEHINLYLNTQWDGSWEGHWGLACILRGDGLLFCVDGEEMGHGLPPPCEANRTYTIELALSAEGEFTWKVDGKTVHAATLPAIAGRSGSLLVGSYEATLKLDSIEIEGVPAAAPDRPK